MKFPPGFGNVVDALAILKYTSTGMVNTTIRLTCLFSFLSVSFSVCVIGCLSIFNLNGWISACPVLVHLFVCLTLNHLRSPCLTYTFFFTLFLFLHVLSFVCLSLCHVCLCLSVYLSSPLSSFGGQTLFLFLLNPRWYSLTHSSFLFLYGYYSLSDGNVCTRAYN